MQIVRILILLLCAAAPAAFAQGGFPTAVETIEVSTSPMQSSVRAVGTLIAEAAAVLRAEVPGQVLEVHFAEGQRVRKGDKLFSIEATVLEAEVNEAKANAERSTAAFERAQEMYSKKLISANDYDAAQANMNVDVARLLSSRAKLSKTIIRAPFDGYVGLRQFELALKHCNDSLAINDSNWRTWNNRAAAHLGKGMYDAALRDVESGLERAPESNTLKKTRALVLERQRAREELQRDALRT